MTQESTIRAYQKVLEGFRFDKPTSFSEDFAVKRFLKKFQAPDADVVEKLKKECWENWLEFDQCLSMKPGFLSGEWYEARVAIHRSLRHYRKGDITFPKGSEFHPTRGFNSIESRLSRSVWSVTPEAFDSFAELVYTHTALKRAASKRFTKWAADNGVDEFALNKWLYATFRGRTERHKLGYAIFRAKLTKIVRLERGARFSSVPKNNANRRPIVVENIGNLFLQTSIGNGLRQALVKKGIDLNHLQMIHRKRISDEGIATIDLKNASDSVSVELCNFLFPNWFLRDLHIARSEMVLGPDGHHYITNKISSMGNGFTFELMTFILTHLCRVLDPTSTVYGDDIIIDAIKAPRLISLLHEVGFVVNTDKSFIEGPFRESCGGNFHRDEGYIRSFDFLWPENLLDCVILHNKAWYLRRYPSFDKLFRALSRVTPASLKGGPSLGLLHGAQVGESRLTETWFIGKFCHRRNDVSDAAAYALQLNPKDMGVVFAVKKREREASPMRRQLRHCHWAKFLSYLYAGRRTADIRTGYSTIIIHKLIAHKSFVLANRGDTPYKS